MSAAENCEIDGGNPYRRVSPKQAVGHSAIASETICNVFYECRLSTK
jgi:hypothetical protein